MTPAGGLQARRGTCPGAGVLRQGPGLGIDETSRARAHDGITLAAVAAGRRVLAVAKGRDSRSVATIVELGPCGGTARASTTQTRAPVPQRLLRGAGVVRIGGRIGGHAALQGVEQLAGKLQPVGTRVAAELQGLAQL